MKQALVTGSETFGRYISNPTKWLALTTDRTQLAGFDINSLVLPCVAHSPEGIENSGEKIVRHALEMNADVILSFGISSDVKGVRLERTGINWVDNDKYCAQDENNRPLDRSQPDKRKIQIDLSPWNLTLMRESFIQAAIPFEPEISDDAGRYACNGWIFRTLLAMEERRVKIPYLFFHVSCTEEAIAMIPDFDRARKTLIKKEELIKVLEIVLNSFQ